MVNRTGRMEEAPAGVEVIAADLYDPAQVRQVTRGARVVYQSAQPEYYRWVEKFPPLQQAIIDGLTGSNAKLVLVENLYMYGETGGVPMTEDMPHNAQSRKGKTRQIILKQWFASQICAPGFTNRRCGSNQSQKDACTRKAPFRHRKDSCEPGQPGGGVRVNGEHGHNAQVFQ